MKPNKKSAKVAQTQLVERLQKEAEKYRNLYCSLKATSNGDYERLQRIHRLPHEN